MSDVTTQFNKLADNTFTGLWTRLVSQEIPRYLETIPSIIEGTEKWVNHVKEYIMVGIPNVTAWDPNEVITIESFKGQNPKVTNAIYSLENKLKVNIFIPLGELTNAFTKPKTQEAFLKRRLEEKMNAVNLAFTKAEANLLVGKPAVLGSATIKALVYDTEISAPLKKGNTDIDRETWVKETWQKMRLYIKGLATPSNLHTKFSTKAGNETFVYSSGTSNLKLILNNWADADLKTAQATLFNKEDVLTNIEKQTIDFQKLLGLTDAENKKVVGFILDKRAIVKGVKLEIHQALPQPNYNVLDESAFWYGYAKLEVFPIAKITTS